MAPMDPSKRFWSNWALRPLISSRGSPMRGWKTGRTGKKESRSSWQSPGKDSNHKGKDRQRKTKVFFVLVSINISDAIPLSPCDLILRVEINADTPMLVGIGIKLTELGSAVVIKQRQP